MIKLRINYYVLLLFLKDTKDSKWKSEWLQYVRILDIILKSIVFFVSSEDGFSQESKSAVLFVIWQFELLGLKLGII